MKKLKIGISDIAEAKGVHYRTALRHFREGRYGEDLLSVAVYICDSRAFRRLAETKESDEEG